jgi:hypothetical protein
MHGFWEATVKPRLPQFCLSTDHESGSGVRSGAIWQVGTPFYWPDKRVKGYIPSLTASFCRLHKKGQSPPHGEVAGGPTGIDPIAPGVRDPRNLKLAKSQIAAVRPLYGKAPIDISA